MWPLIFLDYFVFFNINFSLFPQVKQHSKGMKTKGKLLFVSYMDNKDEDVLYCKCHFVSNSWHRSITESYHLTLFSLSDIDFPSRAKIRKWDSDFFFFLVSYPFPKAFILTSFSLHFGLCKCCNVQQCASLSVSIQKRMFPLGNRHTSFL